MLVSADTVSYLFQIYIEHSGFLQHSGFHEFHS